MEGGGGSSGRRRRPDAGEHHEYYGRYVGLVPDGDIVHTLGRQMEETQSLLRSVPEGKETYRYAPGKWSLREVVGHLIDAERTFAFRSLWIARAAEGALPSMEQDRWADLSNAGGRRLADLTAEWAVLRASNLRLFASYDDAAWARTGMASGMEFSVRAFPWIIAGHELHHRERIRRDYLGEAT